MLGNISLGRYYPGGSVLHRLDPRTKILASIVVMVVIFLAQSAVPMILLGTLTILLILLSQVPFKLVLNGLKPMLFILVFAFVLNLLTVRGTVWLRIGPLSNRVFDDPHVRASMNDAHGDVLGAIERGDAAAVRRGIERDLFAAGQFLKTYCKG